MGLKQLTNASAALAEAIATGGCLSCIVHAGLELPPILSFKVEHGSTHMQMSNLLVVAKNPTAAAAYGQQHDAALPPAKEHGQKEHGHHGPSHKLPGGHHASPGKVAEQARNEQAGQSDAALNAQAGESRQAPDSHVAEDGQAEHKRLPTSAHGNIGPAAAEHHAHPDKAGPDPGHHDSANHDKLTVHQNSSRRGSTSLSQHPPASTQHVMGHGHHESSQHGKHAESGDSSQHGSASHMHHAVAAHESGSSRGNHLEQVDSRAAHAARPDEHADSHHTSSSGQHIAAASERHPRETSTLHGAHHVPQDSSHGREGQNARPAPHHPEGHSAAGHHKDGHGRDPNHHKEAAAHAKEPPPAPPNMLRVTCTPQEAGTYQVQIVLSSPTDVRVMLVEMVARRALQPLSLVLECPARQKMTQEVSQVALYISWPAS